MMNGNAMKVLGELLKQIGGLKENKTKIKVINYDSIFMVLRNKSLRA